MSLLFTPSVHKSRDRVRLPDTTLVQKTLAALMDASGFAAVRDYCVRQYFPTASVTWMADKHFLRRAAAWSSGKTPTSDPQKCFEWLCGIAFSATDAASPVGVAERTRLTSAYSSKFCEIWAGPQGPYEKVGNLMRFILTIPGLEQGVVRLNHRTMRQCMDQWLNALVCDEYKKHPDRPAWDVPPSVTLAGITGKMSRQLPSESMSTMFTANAPDRVAVIRGARVEFDAYPKSAGEFIESAAVRREILSDLSPGQLQMTTPWLHRGMQLNGFSWRTFSLFLERHYMMTATEKTFDKPFFCELISRGSGAWSTQAFEAKYIAAWDAAYVEWVAIAQVVIPAQPSLAVHGRMSSLPTKVQSHIAAATVAMWPGMVLSPECMALASSVITQNGTLAARVEKSEFSMEVRKSFDLLYKAPATLPGQPSKTLPNFLGMSAGGATEWPIHEHLALRFADMDISNQPAPLPADVTGYFDFSC